MLICFNPGDELRRWPDHRHGFRLYELPEVEAILTEQGLSVLSTCEAHDTQQGQFVCVRAPKPVS